MNRFLKILSVTKREFIRKSVYINVDFYMAHYTKYLRKVGIQIEGTPKYISPDAYFDGNDYSKIKIGDNITISREVMILTHDYSITTAAASIGKVIKRNEGELFFSKKISIGRNCFIGARVSLLPGTTIGDNVIIGACSVVKGIIPDDSIVIGNPCRVIGNTKQWVEKQLEMKEYFIE